MEVKLINYTPNARELLIFTKSTRLEMTPGLWDEIVAWPEEKKAEELAYMARTIPSSWEFVNYAFLITGVTRAFTHQFIRTRHGSYAQQTMRMVNMSNFKVLVPPSIEDNPGRKAVYEHACEVIGTHYNELINDNCPAEDARGLLPTNILTNICASFNLRTLSELCKSRTGGRTQDEYRIVMNAMADEVLAVHPWAHQFLFPAGRDKFKTIEEALTELKKTRPALAYDAMKDVDLLRKEQ